MNNKIANEKKNKIIDIIIKILLVITIIILLLQNCSLMEKDNKKKEKTPTGNVDIIEINCDKKDTCQNDNEDDKDKKNDNSKNKSNNNKKSDSTKPTSGEDVVIEDDKLLVYDEDITWHGKTKAKIFSNSMYKVDNTIAPESYNTYQFIVKNGTDYNLNYTIDFIENNPYNINMKYKLRKNDTYIIDHYVSASELNLSKSLLKIDKNDTYYLDWKWISSDNDTEIGTNPNSKYQLKIDIKAESTNE